MAIFNKNSHIGLIKQIANGLKLAGVLDNYLELGVQRGNCFNEIAPLANNAYAVDIIDSYSLIKHNSNLKWFQGKTLDFLKNCTIKFDLIFIDADHSYEASLEDFKYSLPLIKENGLILLHDTYPPTEEYTSKSYCYDTYKTAFYIRENFKDIECVTLPMYYGVTIVRNLNRQLLWSNYK